MSLKFLVSLVTFGLGTLITTPFQTPLPALSTVDFAVPSPARVKAPESFASRTLHGYIGDRNVSMKLRSDRGKLSGYYWTQNGPNVPVSGTMRNDGTVILEEFTNLSRPPNRTMRGKWKKDEGDIGLRLYDLSAAYDPNASNPGFFLSDQLFD